MFTVCSGERRLRNIQAVGSMEDTCEDFRVLWLRVSGVDIFW